MTPLLNAADNLNFWNIARGCCTDATKEGDRAAGATEDTSTSHCIF